MFAILVLCLIAPGLMFAYAVLLRPLLHRVPELKDFYDHADGFWATVWALCGKSMTMLWGYILAGISSAFALLGPLASLLGDPELKTQVTTTLQDHPQMLGYVMLGVSVITIAARLRGLLQGT